MIGECVFCPEFAWLHVLFAKQPLSCKCFDKASCKVPKVHTVHYIMAWYNMQYLPSNGHITALANTIMIVSLDVLEERKLSGTQEKSTVFFAREKLRENKVVWQLKQILRGKSIITHIKLPRGIYPYTHRYSTSTHAVHKSPTKYCKILSHLLRVLFHL